MSEKYVIDTSIPLDKYQVLCGQVRRQIFSITATFATSFAAILWLGFWIILTLIISEYFIKNEQWAVIILLFVLLLATLSFYKIVIPWLNRVIPARKGIEHKKTIDGSYEVSVDGIIFSDQYSYSKFEWAGFQNVFDMPGAVGLYKSPLTFLIPNESFESREIRQEFISFCKAQIAAHKEG